MNKQNRKRLMDTENRLMVPEGREVWELGEKDEALEKCVLAVTK